MSAAFMGVSVRAYLNVNQGAKLSYTYINGKTAIPDDRIN